MKRILTILLLITFLNSSDAQWFSLNSGTTSNLNALCVVDPLTVYVVGDGGIILRTTDGGQTWDQQIPVTNKLWGVSFCNHSIGLAVGENGVILKTTDGGNVWFTLNSGVTGILGSVWCSNPNNVTILQLGATYMTSNNGGATWQSYTPYIYPYTYSIKGMTYTNWGSPRQGAFVGAGFRNNPLGSFFREYYTSTDGINWNSFWEQTNNSFSNISILPDGEIFVTTITGEFYKKTTTGWELRCIVGEVVDLFFVNSSSGTILKSDGIYTTSDGGWNWKMVYPYAYKSVVFADSLTGYAIGDGGSIIKTINGGIVRNFFPSELNNKYQTKVFVEGVGPGGGGYQSATYYESHEIIQDTTINGKRFIRFSGYDPFNPTYFYHYDQAEQKLFIKIPSDDSIHLAADFNIPAGDTIISYISGEPLAYISAGLSNIYLFNDSVQAYRMDFNILTKKFSYTFADNIGLSRFYRFGVMGVSYWGASTYNLFSAIVDSVIYNPIYLNIYSVSPLVNRPVNSFPFVINGYYNTNLNLVDTFFVEVIHLRGIDTIGRLSYRFNNNAANITLVPLVGDRLLVKAHIRDNSIFHNYDTFPDSGYAEILVLPSTVGVDDNIKVYSFRLEQNYPNPFNPTTNISYSIPERLPVSISIYDPLGNEIIKAVNDVQDKGEYTCTIDCSGLSSGIYIYKINAGTYTAARKMILVK